MPKVWSQIKPQNAGFSAVEVLLAATIFGFLAVSLIGAMVYGNQSADNAGDNIRAQLLAEEGVEAMRNIRDAGYANLVDGTYGLAQSGNTWVTSGASDITDIYTRQVIVANNGTNRKQVTSRVSWQAGTNNYSTDATTQLTNWFATLVKSWAKPTLQGSVDASGTTDGIKVATQGNYAYVIRNSGTPNFMIFNISTATPTLVGSLTLTGTPTNIAVSGNYAYVSNRVDTAELQTVNVTTPAAPTLTASYNATGAGDGQGVYFSNGYIYLARANNSGTDEIVIVNVATPASPSRTYGFSASGISFNEVYVNNNNVYAVTANGKVYEFVPTLFGLIYVTSIINLSTTASAITIAGNGTTLFVGQGTTFYTIDGGLTNAILGTRTLPGTVNDIDSNVAGSFAYAGTSATAGEFQVLNITTLTNPTIVGAVDIAGTASTLNGVAYNATLNVVAGASASDTQEAVVFAPN